MNHRSFSYIPATYKCNNCDYVISEKPEERRFQPRFSEAFCGHECEGTETWEQWTIRTHLERHPDEAHLWESKK